MIGATEKNSKGVNVEVQLLKNNVILDYSRNNSTPLCTSGFIWHTDDSHFQAVYFIHNINKANHIKEGLMKPHLL